jgi:asparagine synthase (glutamine-hydrolysing)
MCGIVGITWKDRKLTAARAARVAHRGPAQSGLYDDASVSLGHQRVEHPRPVRAGASAHCGNDGSVVVVLNGEVYNFGEIRRELELCRLRKHADSVWQQPL